MNNTFLTDTAQIFRILSDLNPLNFRYLFYLVTPNETIYQNVDDIPNFYLNPAVTCMFAAIFLEYSLIDKKKYAFNDTVTSINGGLIFLIMKCGGYWLSSAVYPIVYDRLHVVDLPNDSALVWIICLVTNDFAYYLGHRAIHEIGIFWALHQMHHSSEYYNLSTGLRLGSIQDIGHLFFELLQAFAIPPNIFVAHRYLNTIWQFWLHANAVPHLGPLEYIINTPSSHRVHHGRNPYCIDRNYGAVFSIWDRLFGTYEPERKDEEIAYGLVKPVASFNQLWCQLFAIKTFGFDKGQMKNEKNDELFPGLWNKVKAALWPPAYFPGTRTKPFFLWLSMEDHTEGTPEVERPVTIRYSPPLARALRYYLLAQWVLLMSCFLQFDKLRLLLSWPEFLCRLGFIFAYIQMFGYYFDHSRFSLIFDSTRLTLSILLGLLLSDPSMIVYGFASLALLSWLASDRKGCLSCGRTEKKCFV